ncbi:uncharacterized protein CELE_T04D3.5 [Caenorhabditis elegans]|uniref:Uncharacterized protein n=1 Tax=Caenorhabditis elegans TaxID=6239 RepID=O02299_CAEEL|nr:Uncharacterized protein CELE_T04D3.5 [Caenorhabditis elegans]CAB03287.1 Uncharacterized protein CELE_T04D3.5 [Caenorhabditis elegans]|eukprot:NP_493345.1 Uncharacterized protein CELE_T04D3.5 [Caenorhabditis elegans]
MQAIQNTQEIRRQADLTKAQWWLQQLCETDRMIVGRKRRDVQKLIHRLLSEPKGTSVPKSSPVNRLFPHPLSFELDPKWPAMDSFYNRISAAMRTIAPKKTASQQVVISCKQLKPAKLDMKTLRQVMEHELAELGDEKLQRMVCSFCYRAQPTHRLYTIEDVIKCQECWRGPFPSRTIFDALITDVAEKWAEKVAKRVECLYGNWDEKLTPMVRMLQNNVLLSEDIAALLRTCTDPHEFKEACEVIIITTIVFYLEYVDFRRSCEALMAIKPTVTYGQLFEIFQIYFPNRAKGIKTGDFL